MVPFQICPDVCQVLTFIHFVTEPDSTLEVKLMKYVCSFQLLPKLEQL